MTRLEPEWWDRVASDDRAARVTWAHLTEPEDPRACELVRTHGPGAALHRVLERGKDDDAVLARLVKLDLTEQLRRMTRLSIRTVVPGDDEWPEGLDDLPNPPHCLFVRGQGNLRHLAASSVAIVGARAATHYGQRIAAEMALGLGGYGINVVSGGAFGIDAAAHRGALRGEASTICVEAGGVERAYPSAHAGLFDAIAAEGVIVSEAPVGAAPMRHRFLHRNRLIAAMAPGTVVVEAGLRSGSLSTARRAESLSRLVGAVPGPVTSAASAGCHELIRDGAAVLVSDAAHVRELVGSYDAAAGEWVDHRTLDRPEDTVSEVAKLVWDALPVSSAVNVAEAARRAGRAQRETFTALGELSASGLAVKGEAGWRKARRGG